MKKNSTLIYMPSADGNYIEILGHKIDGFKSFESFMEHIQKYSELEEENRILKASLAKWNNVHDGEPKQNGRYLCVCTAYNHKYFEVLSYAKNLEKVDEYDFRGCKHGGWYMYDSEYGHIELNDVTHWMPLPELPKDGE